MDSGVYWLKCDVKNSLAADVEEDLCATTVTGAAEADVMSAAVAGLKACWLHDAKEATGASART